MYDIPVIVASCGRAGSSMVAHQIHKALGTKEVTFICEIGRLDYTRETVWKTHDPKLPVQTDYHAVYLYDGMLDVIASMYVQPKDWLVKHLRHLHVSEYHQERFWQLHNDDVDLAWRYMIYGDRLRLRENVENWCDPSNDSTKVLTLSYPWLCSKPEANFAQLSAFLGVNVPVPEIKDRKTCWYDLPKSIKDAVMEEYD